MSSFGPECLQLFEITFNISNINPIMLNKYNCEAQLRIVTVQNKRNNKINFHVYTTH